MKYEKPQVVELDHAIVAVQSGGKSDFADDGSQDATPAYEDWE